MFYKANNDGYKTMLDGIRMKTLVHGERTLLSEFKLDKGAVIPKHQHPQEQTGYLISGSLRFSIGEESQIANPGDSWNLPSEIVHGAEALEDSVVIEVFSPVREDYLP
jgi:quercetin dioxygenase-like cupin family protein